MAGALGVVLWGSETALITLTQRLPPFQTVALAFAFAACLSAVGWWVTQVDIRSLLRQPPRVWLLTTFSLTVFHSCIYFAVRHAPPASSALLQGTTPLVVVFGSALLGGQRVRWWHLVGVGLGFTGVAVLVGTGSDTAAEFQNPGIYLALIAVAAALWGLYSILSRSLADVPSSALGISFLGSGVLTGLCHISFEHWIDPSLQEWLAIAGLGALPMGLAIFLWDFGVKRGDLQSLSALSYLEPLVGAVLVAAVGRGYLTVSMLWSGILIVGGATVASYEIWSLKPNEARIPGPRRAECKAASRLDVPRSGDGDPRQQMVLLRMRRVLTDVSEVLLAGQSGSLSPEQTELCLGIADEAVTLCAGFTCELAPFRPDTLA